MISIPGIRPSTAESIARVAHGGQRHGHRDFIEHPRHVVEVLKRFDVLNPEITGDWGEELITAGWLHDIVEDTEYPLVEVQKVFGVRVAELVDAVTDVPKNDRYPNRTARKTATLQKTAGYHWPWAVVLKLADRIANVEYSWACPDQKFLGMYRKEQPEFREALLRPTETGLVERMFQYLDHLLAVPNE